MPPQTSENKTEETLDTLPEGQEGDEQGTAEGRGDEAPETSESTSTEGEQETEADELEADATEHTGAARRIIEKLQKRVEFAERELRRKEQPTPQPVVEKAPEQQKGKPNEDDFENYNDFVEAMADWKAEEKFKAREVQDSKKNVEQKRRDRQGKIDQIVASEIAKDPDFREKAYVPVGPAGTPNANSLSDLMSDSDQFVNIALYFGENPQEAQDLYYLSVDNPMQAAREIGKLEAKLQTRTLPQRTETKAPSPTRPVTGKESAEKRLEDMTVKEHMAHMNKKEFGE